MLGTETLHPAPPSAATPAPQEAPSPRPASAAPSSSRSEITDAPSFLSALIVAHFNFHAVARTVEINLLRHLMSDPDLMAAITEYARHTAAADAVREAEYRHIALDHLAALIRATPGSPHATTPLETRRAATTMLRALAPSREPRFNWSSATHPREPRPPSASSSPFTAPTNTPAASSPAATQITPLRDESGTPVASTPSPQHTPHEVINGLLTHFAHSTRLTPDTAINYFKRFADHGITLDDIPFPLTDPATPFEILLEAALGTCTGSPRGTIIQSPAAQSRADGPNANHTQATLSFAPSPSRGPAAINLTITLTRTPSSRAPNCWLITAANISTAAPVPPSTTGPDPDTS